MFRILYRIRELSYLRTHTCVSVFETSPHYIDFDGTKFSPFTGQNNYSSWVGKPRLWHYNDVLLTRRLFIQSRFWVGVGAGYGSVSLAFYIDTDIALWDFSLTCKASLSTQIRDWSWGPRPEWLVKFLLQPTLSSQNYKTMSKCGCGIIIYPLLLGMISNSPHSWWCH